jgi:hypothetical protein
MKLAVFTIVLDGEPWIEKHLPVLDKLCLDWQWLVVEGAAGNTADTAWCQPQKPRLSEDGTHEYLQSIKDERVTHIHKKSWPNKVAMCNAALERITEPCVLMQIDSDELYSPKQLEKIVELFTGNDSLSSIMFACRYFVGPKLILQGEHCYGDNDYEWLRAWRYSPGRKFERHEPPVLEGDDPNRRMSKAESRKLGLIFDHYAYATEEQCAFKEAFYDYPGLVNQWSGLNAHDKFPVELSRFFSHVTGDNPKVVKI